MRTRAFLILLVALTLLALHALASAEPASTVRARRAPWADEGETDPRADGADHAERAARSERGGDRGDGGDPEAGEDAALAPRRRSAPPIRAVLAAAYAAAGLDRNPGGSWIWRTRLAGLVPWLTVRTARDTSWQDAHSEVGHGTSFEIRATWRLDRLLFDGRELQVATIEAARRRERARVAAQVIRAYYAWRRAVGAARRAGDARRGGDLGGDDRMASQLEDSRVGDARMTTRVDEAVAELDALTDGWLSEQLARQRR